MAQAKSNLSEKLSLEVNDRTWGVLTAHSPDAKQRREGKPMLLTAQEHVLGRAVRDPQFSFEASAISVSNLHCRIFRKSVRDEGFGVFIKDNSSSNGTFINGHKLKKDGPEHRLRDGDVISLASPADVKSPAEKGNEPKTWFAYVFHDTSPGFLKRKQENEAGKPDDSKRMKATGEGPVSLTDVRRLERSNQELRQKLESECLKNENLVTELRSANASTDNMVKEALDVCQGEYLEKLEKLQAELTSKTSACEEFSGKCEQMESTIDDLNKRLRAAQQSRMEAEEALKTIKANREELEKQIERERTQWKRERDEAELLHNTAMEKLRAEAVEELKRQADACSRQLKQAEDEIAAQQESKEACRAQIDNLTKALEDERQTRMDSDKKAQELQILLNNEQRACYTLTEDMKNLKDELGSVYENQHRYKLESEAAKRTLNVMQVEKDEAMSKLKLERQRLEGARDRILLRETQLRAFQTTAEAISVLQQKQQEQLKAMMKTLADDDAEYANAMEKCDNEGEEEDEEKKDGGGDVFKDPEMTQPNGGGGQNMETDDDAEKNYEPTQLQDLAATQMNATQVDATQIEATQFAATQGILEEDAAATQAIEDNAAVATQLVPGAGETESPPEGEEQQAGPAEVAVPLTGLPGAETGARARQMMPGSVCTADLRASESMGSWVNETPPAENSLNSMDEVFVQQPTTDEVFVQQPAVGVFELGSMVGNSDSLMPARNEDPPAFNNTMFSQNSRGLDLNEVALDSGSDTQED